jgi:hypothetical protein
MASLRKFLSFSSAVLVLNTTLSGFALAEDQKPAPPDEPTSKRQQAEAFKARGDSLFRSRNFVDALAAYDESYALFQDPRVLYNKGRALQALGRYGEALRALRSFQETASPELRGQVAGLDELLSDLGQRVSTVRIDVNEDGARVVLGNEVMGTTPLPGELMVNAGVQRLQVSKDGFFPVERELRLEGGGRIELSLSLESKARNGKIVVKSDLPGTTIRVADRVLGQAPSEAILAPGTYRITAHRDGYADSQHQVVLEAGQFRSITLNPTELAPPLYKNPWFWGGVGVVAAGAATTILLLTRNHETTTSGDFSPSVIRSPLSF